jgi:hypothetical protein
MPGIETLEKKKRVDDDTPPPISEIDPKVVLDNVFKQLGKPKNVCPSGGSLTRATACKKREFRVNIFCKPNDVFGSGQLTDSFWVKVNDKGDIVSSDPAINKKY